MYDFNDEKYTKVIYRPSMHCCAFLWFDAGRFQSYPDGYFTGTDVFVTDMKSDWLSISEAGLSTQIF